jgi:phosphogluconate dehydratase
MNSTIKKITEKIIARSSKSRELYLKSIAEAKECLKDRPFRHCLPCSNLAHGMAVCDQEESKSMRDGGPDIAIITAYNDMLSAHNPFADYPQILKKEVAGAGGVAQVAGGVPAMCDGVTQGEPGMDLSLISRDVIAMSVAIGLSHNLFDGVLLLGMCDKIMPGMLMGGLQFGHLPMIMVPAGPMPSGIANREKAKARELFAQGRIDRDEMLEVETRSYHSPGTCTFYGTANSNQLLAEIMGLHLPGSSFVQPDTQLRHALTRAAGQRITSMTHLAEDYTPLGRMICEKTIVNAVVALLATGGSTNQTMHIVAVARAAGIMINWDDFAELSAVTPFITRIYPNGPADINGFQDAGGMAALINELLNGGYLNNEVETVAGPGLEQYTRTPELKDNKLHYSAESTKTLDREVIALTSEPFSTTGGLMLVAGNLGRAVIKTSPLADGADTVVEAPAVVFNDQHELLQAFTDGKLDHDLVAVIRFQGPRGNGMPELHKVITPLSIIMDRGYVAALVTDGRLSGASGKVPSAIHLHPEAARGGLLAKIKDGDIIRLDTAKGLLEVKVSQEELDARDCFSVNLREKRSGMGREIFSPLRRNLMSSEQGGSSIFTYDEEK